MTKNNKSEFSEILDDMSQFAGALVGAAVVAGRNFIHYVNDLITTGTQPKQPPDKKNSSRKNSG